MEILGGMNFKVWEGWCMKILFLYNSILNIILIPSPRITTSNTPFFRSCWTSTYVYYPWTILSRSYVPCLRLWYFLHTHSFFNSLSLSMISNPNQPHSCPLVPPFHNPPDRGEGWKGFFYGIKVFIMKKNGRIHEEYKNKKTKKKPKKSPTSSSHAE